MTHTKEFIRDDKTKVRIELEFKISNSNNSGYGFGVYMLPPRKRIWKNVVSDLTETYTYRKMNDKERKQAILSKQLEYVTKEEIYAAKLELWQKLKPTV